MEDFTTLAKDEAAANGHLEVLKWLHQSGALCTTSAMEWAARNSRLSVATWLHLNRSEGCTEEAMDDAAACDNSDVVLFLHHNRHEGCGMLASACVADFGEMKIVQWLKELYAHRFDSAMVRYNA